MDNVEPDKDWEPTRLIQRLQSPYRLPEAGETPLQMLMNAGAAVGPFSFGGGFSGHNALGVQLLGLLFRYDYMGRSEFEHGVVGSSISAIERQMKKGPALKSVVKEVDVPDFYRPDDEVRDPLRNSRKRLQRQPCKHPHREIKRRVYIICREDWLVQGMPQHIIDREADPANLHLCYPGAEPDSSKLSWEDYRYQMSRWPGLKVIEPTRLWEALVADEHRKMWEPKWSCEVIGGLECTNAWIYFVKPDTAAYFWLLMGGGYNEMHDDLQAAVSQEDAAAFEDKVVELCQENSS